MGRRRGLCGVVMFELRSVRGTQCQEVHGAQCVGGMTGECDGDWCFL